MQHFHQQRGTAVYGVTKMAFHRMYEQLNAEQVGVPVASLSPGMVDTEGVRDHVAKARALALPHVQYFDQAFEQPEKMTTPMAELMDCVDALMAMDAQDFGAKEWRFAEWRASRAAAASCCSSSSILVAAAAVLAAAAVCFVTHPRT